VTGGPQGEQHWHGIAVIDQPTTDALVETAYRHGIQVFAHCNADAAIDQLIAAHRSAVAAGATPPGRTIPIHSQVMRHDQLDEYVELDFEPSMFTVHTYFFGDVHVANFGLERAAGISPMASAYAKGLRPTNHSDYPVTPLAMTWMIWSSVARTTLTGTVLGESERASRWQALRAVTINAAYQYGLEGDRGSLEPGKLADLVFLDGDPLTVETDALRDLKVLRTVKRGVVVFEANPVSETE
jgi:predicted amidohydrolase YtcJ